MLRSTGVRRSIPLVLALALVLPAAARAQIEEPRIPLQTKMSELNRFRTEYAENYNKKDVGAVVAMYSEDAMIVWQNGEMTTGRDAVRQGLSGELPHLVINSENMTIYGNTAVDMGHVLMHPAGGGEIKQRYLVVLRRDMNGWKLVRASVTPIEGM